MVNWSALLLLRVHGCSLYFNSAGTNTGDCSENDVCICRAPDGGGRGGDTALTLATEGGGGGDAVAIALPIIAVLVVLGLLVAVLVYWKRKRAAAGAPAEPTAVEISVTAPPQLPATSSSNVVEGMPVSATEVPPPVRASSATAAAAMLVDSTGDGLADAVHVDTTGDGRPDTIVPLGESAHARPLNASDMELEVRELRKSIAETKRQRSLTRQALEDALRAGGGESNTSVAGEPVPPAPVPPQYLCPITGEIMEDPVTTADGHAYERAAIAQWLQNHDTSPVTNAQLPHRKLAPAHALRQLIQEFVAAHPEALMSTEPSYTERRCSSSI